MGRIFRLITILLVILFMLPIVFSKDFIGHKYPREPFSLNDDNFTINIDNSWQRIFLKINNEPYIINKGVCEIDSFYKLCFLDITINFEKNFGKLDERTGEVIPALNLSITYLKPNITLQKNYTEKNPLVGEQIRLDGYITNKGNKKARIIVYDPLPPNSTIALIENAILDGERLIISGTLNFNNTIHYSYLLVPNKEIYFNMTPKINVTYEDINIEYNFTKVPFYTKKSINMSFGNIKKEITIPLSSEYKFQFNLTNIESRSIDSELYLKLPKEISFISSVQDFKKISEGNYILNNQFEAKERKKIAIILSGSVNGTYNVTLTTKTKLKNLVQAEDRTLLFKVAKSIVTPNITTEYSILSSGQIFLITADIKNNDNITDFYDLNIEMESPFIYNNTLLDMIRHGQKISIFKFDSIAPSVLNKTKYDITFKGTYNNKIGESFTFSSTKIITVYPPQDVLNISHEFDRWENTSNLVRMSVYIKNSKDSKTNALSVSDDIPDDMELMEGEIKNDIVYIEPFARKKVYTYTLRLPESLIANRFYVITTIKYNESESEIIINKKSEIKVNLTNKKIETTDISTEIIESNISKLTDPNPKVNIPAIGTPTKNVVTTEKKSFWTKIVDFFSDLFG